MRDMKKLLILAVLSSIPWGVALSQDKEYQKLNAKYADGKVEQVLSRAMAMMDNDKYRKDAYPALWAAKAYLGIATGTDEKLKTKYPKPLLESLKYANKAIQKDKEGTLMSLEQDFVKDLRMACFHELADALPKGDMRRAYVLLRGLGKVFNDDAVMGFIRGVYDIDTGNQTEGEVACEKNLVDIRDKFSKNLEYKFLTDEDVVMKTAVLRRIDQLANSGKKDEARKMILNAKLFFPLDKDVDQRESQLN